MGHLKLLLLGTVMASANMAVAVPVDGTLDDVITLDPSETIPQDSPTWGLNPETIVEVPEDGTLAEVITPIESFPQDPPTWGHNLEPALGDVSPIENLFEDHITILGKAKKTLLKRMTNDCLDYKGINDLFHLETLFKVHVKQIKRVSRKFKETPCGPADDDDNLEPAPGDVNPIENLFEDHITILGKVKRTLLKRVTDAGLDDEGISDLYDELEKLFEEHFKQVKRVSRKFKETPSGPATTAAADEDLPPAASVQAEAQ